MFVPKRLYYLIDVYGCVEPSIVGPFLAAQDRDVHALTVHADQSDEDALFRLDVDYVSRQVFVNSYPGVFFEEAKGVIEDYEKEIKTHPKLHQTVQDPTSTL